METSKIVTIVVSSIVLLITHLIEAKREAKRGDAKHWPSLLLQGFVTICIMAITDSFIPLFMFIAVRSWFDLMYNHYKGLEWYYLGSTAWTDRQLKKVHPVVLFGFRVVISALCVYIMFKKLE